MSRVVAERAFDVSGKEGAGFVRIYSPVDEGNSWRCDYQISWPGMERKFNARGVDSWQAIQLAMQIVPVELSVTDEFKDGLLGVFGASLRTDRDLIEWLGVRPMKVMEE